MIFNQMLQWASRPGKQFDLDHVLANFTRKDLAFGCARWAMFLRVERMHALNLNIFMKLAIT